MVVVLDSYASLNQANNYLNKQFNDLNKEKLTKLNLVNYLTKEEDHIKDTYNSLLTNHLKKKYDNENKKDLILQLTYNLWHSLK